MAYEAEGWGTGELIFEDGLLAWHELPREAFRNDVATEVDPLAKRMVAFLGGARDSFADVELDLEWATLLQRSIVDALRGVPRGEVVSYGELAALAGRPRAPRAAGAVCSENRFSFIVPCHRVVSATGIGGYGDAGVDVKRRLLALEGVIL